MPPEREVNLAFAGIPIFMIHGVLKRKRAREFVKEKLV
jgi:hypothetical protein